jgi:ribosomal protein L11 methyltransferase
MNASPPQGPWPEAIVVHDPEVTEALTHFLFQMGASAVQQSDAPEGVSTRAGFPRDTIVSAAETQLDGFLHRLAEIFQLKSAPTAKWLEVEPDDWAEKWKEGLGPLVVGPTLAVKPTWSAYTPLAGQTVLALDPGLAFGAGQHPTTFMCLQILEEYLRSPARPPDRILDVGSGSGILSLAAAALSTAEVAAVDIDPETLPVAEENLARNNLSGRVALSVGGPQAAAGPFDLILANLTASILIQLQPAMLEAAGGPARLILSGILNEQADDVVAAYEAAGCRLDQRRRTEEWTALVMVRE